MALDIIWQLLCATSNHPSYAAWVDDLEIYVIPCLNPDGRHACDYIYSLWRKNGRDNDHNGILTYPADGVDLNRNSAFHWGSDDEGSSPLPHSNGYRGPSPASEPEIQAYDALIQRVRPAFTLSLHSYMGVFYGPYGDFNVEPPTPDPFKPLGNAIAADCINEDDSPYGFTSGSEFIYSVNGDRTDANYGLYGILAFGAEIGSDNSGFQPPYATTRDKLVPGIRPGWQQFLAAAHAHGPKLRGWSLDSATRQPAPVRLHSLHFEQRPNDEHWTSRADGYFEIPLPTAGTYRIVASPFGQPSLATTQTFAIGSAATNADFFFAVSPVLSIGGADGMLSWSNQHESGIAQIEAADDPRGPWLPHAPVATVGRTGQAQLAEFDSTLCFRIRTGPRLFSASSPLAVIPSGTFLMGSEHGAPPDEQPTAAIHIDTFAIDAHEVTYADWTRIRAWAIQNGYDFAAGQPGSSGDASASNHPVVNVSWHDAILFCNARSQYEGLLPVYYETADQTRICKTGAPSPPADSVNWNANGYRLPTEAEWEKAARGGYSGRQYPMGNALANADAHFDATGTAAVGSFPPNGLGLFDAAGNVAEWCWDWYGDYAARAPANPDGPADGTARVVRGGAWSDAAPALRCAARASLDPADGHLNVGLRCVRR